MSKGLIVVIVLVLLALALFGQYVSVKNTLVAKERSREIGLVAGGRGPATPRRPDPQPGRNREGLRPAGKHRVRRHRQGRARRCFRQALRRTRSPPTDSSMARSGACLLVIVENYPQLKSNENFLRLQDELAGTENRIAVERKRYNDTLQDYNTYIQQFPNSLFAGWAGFKPNEAYFQASEGSREVPKVNFNSAPSAPQSTPQPAPAH